MKILVYYSKYGESYWDASTEEKREKSARIILSELLSSGWIYEPDDPMDHIEYSSIDLELAQLDDETINALPTESLRSEALRHKQNLATRIKRAEAERKDYEDMVRVAAGEEVEDAKGRKVTAWSLLRDYDDEYVRFEIESVTDPDKV
jgi:hypothetical protein